MGFKHRICCSIVILIIGISCIIVGYALIIFFAQLIHNKIEQSVALKSGSESFENWQDPPVPVYMKFFVFSLVNKYEVLADGRKPVVVQRGPYTYREIRPKQNVKFHANSTLTYIQNKSYVFDRELSVGYDNETVVTVNLLYVTVTDKFKDYGVVIKDAIQTGLSVLNIHLFDQYTVKDLIWGYKVEALKLLAEIIHLIEPEFKLPYDIGLLAGQNGTNDGMYTIYTGKNIAHRVNTINRWKGQKSLSFWGTKYCNMINGTDGTAFQPFINKSETLYIFLSDICRSIYVKFLEDVTVRGIPLYRYTPPANVFADIKSNPDNIGYCTPNCLGAGVLNVSICKGAPVIMSSPHFYQAADKYINAVDGVHPIPSLHRTTLDIEPHTGLVLEASKRLQINIFIKNIPKFSDTEKMEDTIFPVAWLDESATLDEASADKIRHEVLFPILLTSVVQYSVLALGVFILAVLLVITVRYVCKRRRSTILVNMADSEVGAPIHVQYDKFDE